MRELEKEAVQAAAAREAARGSQPKLEKYMLRSVACFTGGWLLQNSCWLSFSVYAFRVTISEGPQCASKL